MNCHRHWSLTIYSLDGEDFITAAKAAKAAYARCQQEKCPDTSRLHLQACMGWSNKKSFKQL